MQSTIEEILDLGRWAPSGDNAQNWRFEIVDVSHVVVHGFDTRSYCVYDLDGHSSQISLGALIETIAIAASSHGLRMDCERRTDLPDTHPTFALRFVHDPSVKIDSLIPYVDKRSVQRRALNTRALTLSEKRALEEAIGADFYLQWLEGHGARFRAAKLMFRNAKLRLTMPEAYLVHRDIIEWRARYSEDKVPDRALGVDAMTLGLMQWVMKSWKRVAFFNTYLAGTVVPRIQMDFIPALACGAHFVIKAKQELVTVDDYVAVGRAVQRFWLTVTRLGLFMQPELTPIVFSRYVRQGLRFSSAKGMYKMAQRLEEHVNALIDTRTSFPAFMGRVGAGSAPFARSLRLPLARLMKQD